MDQLSNTSHNQLLQSMPESAYQLLAPHIEHVDLPLRFQLEEVHQPIDFVYFIESGLASVVAKIATRH